MNRPGLKRDARFEGPPPLASGRAALVVSLMLAALAFIPFVPRVDPIAGGGTTVRGAMELLMLGGALVLAGYSSPVSQCLAIAAASPPLLAMLAFAAWAGLTALWSPNPVLTVAKSVELVMITSEAAVVAWRSAGLFGPVAARAKLADLLSVALVVALSGILISDVILHGSPLPIKIGEDQVGGLGSLSEAKRPRLLLAYAHPLVAGDMIAMTAIALFASSAGRVLKGMGLAFTFGLIYLTDSRTAMVATPTAIVAIWAVRRYRSHRAAIVILACATGLVLAVAAVLFVNGYILQEVRPGEDFATLNGRVELWEYVWPIFLENWATGVGFYGSRYVLISRWAWAGHSHHSVVEVALCLGVIGLGLFAALAVMAVKEAARTGDGLLVGFCTYLLIVGNIDPILIDTSLPTFLFLIALFHAAVLRAPEAAVPVSRPARPPVVANDTGSEDRTRGTLGPPSCRG